jgi:hypothetical protein
MRRVITTWWPLAASWALMSLEGPALSAVIARLPEPRINLAAYGGVVFPLALIIESPIIMLLAASTALSKDRASYQLIWRFTMVAGALLTALHALIAFTPLYYILVEDILGVPQVIVEPARLGLKLMLPWTWSIAYRRFNQGALIRFGHSQTVGVGTLVRLSANLLVLAIGYWIGTLPGVAVASSAVAMGVMSEAFYVGLVVRPVRKNQVQTAVPVEPALTWAAFYAFYIPLMMTSLLTLLANPISSAAISRMPLSLDSLAVMSVVLGFVFLLRSMGTAYNEVVVALLDLRGSYASLKRFASLLILTSTGVLLLVAATPLSSFWFVGVTALSSDLALMAQRGLWLALPLPALTVLQSWYQGALLHGRRTRGITESVAVYLITSALVLGFGIAWGGAAGLYIGVIAISASVATQTVWLWWRSRPVLKQISEEES